MPAASSKKSPAKKGPVRDIALKTPKEEESFTVHRIHSSEVPEVEPLEQDSYQDSYAEPTDYVEQGSEQEAEPEQYFEEPASPAIQDQEPRDTVKVNFRKFVQLVASHDLEEVLKNNENENVILSSNLLTELAGAHDEEKEGRKTPIILLVGLAMGFVLAYILFSSK